MDTRIFHLHALSPLHCGTGQSTGVVDLPIARARATRLPIVPGSSLRGVLREHLSVSPDNTTRVERLFGPAQIRSNDQAFAGALAINDAHLLALPVRALTGIVCYATSPFVLRRYAEDLRRAGESLPDLPAAPAAGAVRLQEHSPNRGESVESRTTLVLEDLDLRIESDSGGLLAAWAQQIVERVFPGDADSQAQIGPRIALLPDDVFAFLAETATDVRARIAIDQDSGTVKQGALWYEENLPADSLLWGVYAVAASRHPEDREEGASPETADALAACLPDGGALLQIGGKAGVGRGLVRFLRTLGVGA
ncbi:type III-B CRISPR module RAMP protein Cmr4 [Marichromatium gracile]|uniref:Type III-B CRISPR module RAMP protein Cmr4 n=1 Tax=Marichromatium gracile TaxID=1048 RepID=A0ABR5VKS8_MARGR|nr:type III-B CRISPR module RAMP protein Cmr4 [Marichromatium gracile]KXX64818.1 type III-B CRISPR module RAMP protein Cmr4 [Marichromatium gracile]